MNFPEMLSASDLALLAAVQENADLTLDQLADRAGLSASAVQRRLKKLRDAGVIQRTVALLDPKAVGQTLSLIVELELERDRHDLLPPLQAWIAREAAIQNAWFVTGRGDLVLSMTAASIESFDAFMERMLADHRVIRKYTTSVVLKTLKRSLAVALEPGFRQA